MARKSSPAADGSAKLDPRQRVIEALMALCAERAYREVTLNMIAERAEVTLADLRDLFPSKGAMLGGFGRMIDRKVLTNLDASMADQPTRERVLDVMLKRFEAMTPYKAALASIRTGLAGDIASLAALNQAALNSWRYLLAAADVETEDDLGLIKLQGAVAVFSRAFETWLEDDEPEMVRTMAVLDRELKRGEWVLERAEGLHRVGESMRAMMGGLANLRMRGRRRGTERAYSRDEDSRENGDDYAPAI